MRVDFTVAISRDVLEEEIVRLAHRLDEAANLTSQAHLFAALGRYDHADPLYRASLKIKEDVLGAGSLEVALGLEDLAELHEMRHEYAIAMVLYQRAVEVKTEILGALHPDVIKSASVLKRFELPEPGVPPTVIYDSPH